MLKTMKEYAIEFGTESIIRRMTSNPAQLVAEADWLPYDEIIRDEENDIMVKVVYINDTDTISVHELISLDKDKITDKELLDLYNIYMENIKIEPITLDTLIKTVKAQVEKSKELKGCLT